MKRKILAVDDERAIARLVEVNLVRQGYEVTLAYDGLEAIEKIRLERPDLIVCDVMMPRMDGFEVLRHLKADPATRDIPIIMLTAKSQDTDVYKGWAGGAAMYLTKPFNPMELTSFIRGIFRSEEEENRIRI